MRQPWFRDRDGWWYVSVKVNGKLKQHKLSKDKEEAWKLWRTLDTSPFPSGGVSLYEVFSRWAAWSERRLAPTTVTWYASHIADFLTRYGKTACRDLRPHHLSGYLTEINPGWSKERGVITSVKVVLNWGVEQGLIDKNTLASFKRPPAKRREYVPEVEMVAKLIAGANPQFRTVLVALLHTGARQSAIRNVTADHFVPAMQAWVFAPKEHKTGVKTGKALVVKLKPCMLTLTRILAAKHPKGPLFRNTRGEKWKKDAIKDAFNRLKKRLDIPKDFVPLSFRHKFATDGMLKGLGVAVVAQLLGHTDTTMVSRHYGHLDQQSDFLTEQLRRLDEGKYTSGASPDSPPESGAQSPPPPPESPPGS